ncbi:hypothetical protein BpHYR1_004831 [Brachionus plicatilis]|uniref:Uncharacterized protein n=1 Tax=Brachionus plicatilis TaxID=10195 RepID=A0A3M7QLE0_BRAPC|nr:hypothetical protein BpHYR1_004831 [Brachionus plicatilis]
MDKIIRWVMMEHLEKNRLIAKEQLNSVAKKSCIQTIDWKNRQMNLILVLLNERTLKQLQHKYKDQKEIKKAPNILKFKYI